MMKDFLFINQISTNHRYAASSASDLLRLRVQLMTKKILSVSAHAEGVLH